MRDTIIQLLEASFDGKAWYGSPVMNLLKEIDDVSASRKISENTHSIVELVLHMIAWRNFVIKKLKGVDFEMTDELNFPEPVEWKLAITQLEQSQKRLLEAIRFFPESRLGEQVPGRQYSYSHMLFGIVQHDVYHLGQIALIRRGNSAM